MQSSLTPYRFCFQQQEQLSATRIDALSCIKSVQACVAGLLKSLGATERLVRMAHWDVLETLLARAGACIADSSAYPNGERIEEREAFMRLHLEFTLVTWLGTHAADASELASARRCLRQLQARSHA